LGRFFNRKPAPYAPFKGKKVTVDTGKHGFTVKGPVPSEYVVAAKGNTNPTYWNKVIAKWEAKPLYQRKNEANLYKLIEKETDAYDKRNAGQFSSRPIQKTVIREVKTPQPSTITDTKAEAPAAKREPVRPMVSQKPYQVPVGIRFNQKTGSTEVEDKYVPFSKETARRLQTKDISGKKYAESPNQVARDLNISGNQKKRFMKVLTGRMKFQDLQAGEFSKYDRFRNRVRAGGARLKEGEGSF
jgi:hypothetical protein